MLQRMSLLVALCGVLTLGGCTEKSGSKTETKVSTPGGTTTTTVETQVKKSGENPPPADNSNN